MKQTGPQHAFPCPRRRSSLRRLGADGRMLAGYVAFFAVALLIFNAMILASLLP